MGGGDASKNAQPPNHKASSDPLSIHAPATNDLAIHRVIMTCALSPNGNARGPANCVPYANQYRRDRAGGCMRRNQRAILERSRGPVNSEGGELLDRLLWLQIDLNL